VKKLKVGNGLEPDTDLGPMIDENSMNNFLQYIDDAVSKGGKLVHGGKRLSDGKYEKGYFVSPAVIMAAISAFNTMEEVVEKANATEHGLAAYIYTQSTKTAFLAAEQIEAGTIGINDDVPSTTIAPFGGFKQSGLGRECGQEGIEAFMEVKHISIVL
jgi:succinate-semialdehyde dehydrogenase/glutarate-semialdehyde dehydrogenase